MLPYNLEQDSLDQDVDATGFRLQVWLIFKICIKNKHVLFHLIVYNLQSLNHYGIVFA